MTITITERPIDEAMTCLDMVSYIGQVTGNFAKCNTNGALELKWYDLTAFEESDSLDGGICPPYSSGDSCSGNFLFKLQYEAFQTNDIIIFYNFTTPTISVDDVGNQLRLYEMILQTIWLRVFQSK